MTIPDLYSSPKFYNKKVQEINTDLTALGWIDLVYPITQVGEDSEGTFPETYQNDGSKYSIRAFPAENSMSFWVLNDPIPETDESDVFTVPLSLIVWADLTKVYPNKGYNYTDELINAVKAVIKNHSGYELLIEQQGIFDEYTQLEKLENQNVMLPNTAFKITFLVDISSCA